LWAHSFKEEAKRYFPEFFTGYFSMLLVIGMENALTQTILERKF